MKILTVSINPRQWAHSWGLALRNWAAGMWELARSHRLWIGLGVSVAVHAVVLLLSIVPASNKIVSGKLEERIIISIPPDENPKVIDVIRDNGFTPVAPTATDLEYRPVFTDLSAQADIEEIDFSSLPSTSHGILRINSDNARSTDEILREQPLTLIPGKSEGTRGTYFTGGPGIVITDNAPVKLGDPVTTYVAPVTDIPENTHTTVPAQSGYEIVGIEAEDIIYAKMPAYLESAKRQGLSNVQATVRFKVDADGKVLSTMVMKKSTGSPQWDEMIKKSLAQWKFKPVDGPNRPAMVTFYFILK